MNLLNYDQTKFLKSYSKITDIDVQYGIEIAFIGYSNSGKSSAINTLTNQKKLARCSKTPGRTQLINFFEVILGFRLVDLPGYGYSNIPFAAKKNLTKLIYNYLANRRQLKCIVLLMDIRFPCKKLDHKIIKIATLQKIFILVLLSKCDKLNINQQKMQLNKVYTTLHSLTHAFHVQLFSSAKKIGVKELKMHLNFWYKK